MARNKPVNPTLLPVAAASISAFLGISLFLGSQMAEGKDPKVKAKKRAERPVKTVIKHKVITKKVIVWKTPKPAKSYAAPAQTAQSYTAPAQSYTPPAQSYTPPPAQSYTPPAEPSPAPPVQSGAS